MQMSAFFELMVFVLAGLGCVVLLGYRLSRQRQFRRPAPGLTRLEGFIAEVHPARGEAALSSFILEECGRRHFVECGASLARGLRPGDLVTVFGAPSALSPGETLYRQPARAGFWRAVRIGRGGAPGPAFLLGPILALALVTVVGLATLLAPVCWYVWPNTPLVSTRSGRAAKAEVRPALSGDALESAEATLLRD